MLKQVLIGALLATPAGGTEDAEPLSLSSLREGCRIEKRWIGKAFDLVYGAWLMCDHESTLMIHPWNLVGKVHIKTQEQALEYVRFFSSPETADLFRMRGMMEIVPGVVHDNAAPNVVDEKAFRERFEEPIVREGPPGFMIPLPGNVDAPERKGNMFHITRTVVFYDDGIYQVEESVYEDGFYKLHSKKLLLKDPLEVGVLHRAPY